MILTRSFSVFLIGVLIGAISNAQVLEDRWQVADSLTLRLRPSAFRSLPLNIVSFLEREGYTIPQCYSDTIPHNVISGEFAKRGQKDWAVLASKNRSSLIFVFWKGSEQDPATLALNTDSAFLQGIGGDKIGFSRMIYPVRKSDHDGIDDYFESKASIMHYFHNGKWVQLEGSD